MKIIDTFENKGARTVEYLVSVKQHELLWYRTNAIAPRARLGAIIADDLRSKGNSPRVKWRRKANRRWRALTG